MSEYFSKSEPIFTISAVAGLLNVSVHTLRMYEREGLIIPFKKESNQRLYSQNDIDRIRCIRKTIKEDKISINGIKSIYSLIPCSNIINCNINEKESCRAFNENVAPCWSFKTSENKRAECFNCTVYKGYSACTDIKELINKMKRN